MSELSKYAILYMPEDTPAGVIQIIHGMAEYQGLFREFAQYLSEQGYAVITSDLRGHGNHISRNTELGFFDDNAISRMIGDIHEITLYVREHFPHAPYFLLGQGMGALLATAYFKKYDSSLDGLFLSGMPAYRPLCPVMELFTRLFILLKGEYYRSRVMQRILLGKYQNAFRAEGSPHAWLSGDPLLLERYEQDPKCGFVFTLNGCKTLCELMSAAYIRGSWIRRKLKCPIRLYWGSLDPVTLSKSHFQKTIHLFSDQGYTNVAYITYPEQRHEIFLDTKKETAYRDTLRELETIRGEDLPGEGSFSAAPTHIVLEDFIDPEVEQPLKEEEHINLEEFINARKTGYAGDNAKVDMIDFHEIDQMAAQKVVREEQALDELDELLSGLIDENSPGSSFYSGDAEDPLEPENPGE